jgi:hypothetical protein
MQDCGQKRGFEIVAAERRLERTVAAALRIIDAAHAERQAPPVRAARHRLGKVHRITRLARIRERTEGTSARS